MLSYMLYGLVIFCLVYWLETSFSFEANLLKIKKGPAEELEDWLKKFNWNSRHEPSAQGLLPSYKFYSEIVELLLSLARKMGGNYQDALMYLREGLQADRQFEKKSRELLVGTWLQMGLMVMLTWAFIIGASFMVDVKVGGAKLFLIALWQSLGLGCLPWLVRFYRNRFFGDIGRLWKMLYVLRSLAKVPLSRSEVMSIASVQDLKSIQQSSLSHIVEKLKGTCQKALQVGGSYEAEVLSLMEELRFQEKWHFELFEKRLTVIKLGLMSIFFLPSYLAFMFLLLGDLLTLM